MAQRCALRIAMQEMRPTMASTSTSRTTAMTTRSMSQSSATLIHNPIMMNTRTNHTTNNSTFLLSSSQRYTSQTKRSLSFQATPTFHQEEKPTETAETPSKEKTIAEQHKEAMEKYKDELPEYQNPIMHNNPDYQRVMLDEFGPDEEPPIAPLPPIDDGSGGIPAPPHLHELADEIINLKILEVKELVDRVADHFGFEDTVDFGYGGMGGGGGGGEDGGEAAQEEEKEEKTAFDLKLVGYDAKAKIKVIKEIRSMTSLGLKEAKELVEGVPKTVLKEIKMEEATEFKEKLEALGAQVEIE